MFILTENSSTVESSFIYLFQPKKVFFNHKIRICNPKGGIYNKIV